MEAADTFSDNLQVGSERAKQLKKPMQPKIAHEQVTSEEAWGRLTACGPELLAPIRGSAGKSFFRPMTKAQICIK